MPGMNTVGRNTAESTSAMATTGPETSSMALTVASLGESPCAMWCSTASTTTMASSTTSPMASTRPISAIVLMENPSSGNMAKVPISETGTARAGIRVARQPCRKMNTTMITRISASYRVFRISLMPSRTDWVVSRGMLYSRSDGKFFFTSSINRVTPSTAAIAFDPGSW